MANKRDISEQAAKDLEGRHNLPKQGRPVSEEKMKTYGYAMKPSEYDEIRALVEAEGDVMAIFVRRSIIQAARELRRSRR